MYAIRSYYEALANDLTGFDLARVRERAQRDVLLGDLEQAEPDRFFQVVGLDRTQQERRMDVERHDALPRADVDDRPVAAVQASYNFV